MDPSEFKEVEYGVAGGVATLKLSRPGRGNAWTGRMAAEYRWALHHADADSDVGVIVVTGAGDAFCMGADRDILADLSAAGGAYERARAELPPYPEGTPAGLCHNHAYPLTLSKVVVAAVNGPCAGAGFVVASFADLRIAAEEAKITASFAGMGLPAEYGIAWILPRIIGWQNAFDVLVVNPVLSGRDAVDVGFARRAWPLAGFADRVQEFASAIAQRTSPSAMAVMKRQLYVDANGDLDTAYRRSVDDMNRMVSEQDFASALAATQEGRRPNFLPRNHPTGSQP